MTSCLTVCLSVWLAALQIFVDLLVCGGGWTPSVGAGRLGGEYMTPRVAWGGGGAGHTVP